MAHLTLSVLGEIQVWKNNLPVSSFRSEKARALLAYLAVEAGRSHRREKLVGLFWPDHPEQRARHNLRQTIFNLRLALGDSSARPPFIIITHDAIQFNRECDYWLDLDQFNGYFDVWEKNQSGEGGDQATLISQLEDMVQLYRGEFLQQFYLADSPEFEAWILAQRECLHQRAMNALSCLVNNSEKHADFQTARRYAFRQLELDPWREEAHCQLMRVLALDGQRSAALAQYKTCRRVLEEEFGVEPSPQTRELYEQIRLGSLKPKAGPLVHIPASPIYNLPVSLTPFIGREQELADLAQPIADPDCRCITLVGPGGIGKTRLALQVAEQHRNAFSHGAAFIPLVSIASTDAVIQAIANGIGFSFYGPADPKLQLFNYLREKQILLVLDSVEHLLLASPPTGTIVDLLLEILQQAMQVKLLVTSREILNLQEELPIEIQGLAFPPFESTDGVADYSAVALFIQRARRTRPGFDMNADDKKGVVRLCRLVEGMPLAIELAATWARLLSPLEIAREIENSLDFLKASTRDLPERHRSMRTVFDHSWQTLSGEEKQVLSKLSVFRGGFQRQAAEQVAGASLPVLSSLVIRSLLRHMGTGRYDLHELIRQYAALKLTEDPYELYAVQERHSLYYLGLLEEKDIKLKSHHQNQAVAELISEIDNLRAAWNWSIADQKLIPLHRVSFTLAYLFELRNWFKEGELTFQKTVDALGTGPSGSGSDVLHQVVLQAMLANRGFFIFRQGRSDEAYAILAPCASFLRTRGDPPAAIFSLYYLGIVCWMLGKFTEAEESLEESLALSEKSGDRWFEAMAGEFLGILALDQGRYDQARQLLQKALVIFRQLGDPSMTAHLLTILGSTMQMLGDARQAENLLRESHELSRKIDYRHGMGLALETLGQVVSAQGRLEEARALLMESADLFREIGDNHRLSRTLNHQGLNYLALEDNAGAQNSFKAALRIAYDGGFMPPALEALAGLAAVETRQRASQGTLERIIYILQHPSSNEETKELATRLMAELESRLPKQQIEAAQQRGELKSLAELEYQFLADE